MKKSTFITKFNKCCDAICKQTENLEDLAADFDEYNVSILIEKLVDVIIQVVDSSENDEINKTMVLEYIENELEED